MVARFVLAPKNAGRQGLPPAAGVVADNVVHNLASAVRHTATANPVAQISYVKLLARKPIPTNLSSLKDRAGPIKSFRAEAKGTKLVVRQVGRRKRKSRPLSKNACYDRIVKPTDVQYTIFRTRG